MNKIGKILVTCVLVCGFLLAVTGCTNTDPFVPPEPDGSKVSINDAYDWNEDKTGSTRPGLGGDYVPTLPPTESKVTIAEGSAIRFAGGKTELTLPIGSILKAEDFDASTLGGHQIGGVGVIGESDKINNYITLSDFAPMGDATVMPYFAPENGEPYVFGSSKVGDYFEDAAGNDVDATLATEYRLVGGYMGRSISYEGELKKDTFFRSVTVCEREEGQIYTYHYRFANFGTTDLSFTLYQMYGGKDWAKDGTASDPITLSAGATSDVVSVKVDKNKNDANTLTLIKLDADATGMALGVSMEVENSTVTVPAKITLDLPQGFAVSADYVTDVKTNDKLKLPTAEQITNDTGHRLLYWTFADGTRANDGVRLTGDVTLKPVLTEDAIITLDLPQGFAVSDDYVTKLQTGDLLVLPTEAQITNTTGRKLIRWVDGQGNAVKSGDKVTGNITLSPELAAPVTVTVKLPAGLTIAGYAPAANTGDVIVPPTADQVSGTIADGRKIAGWYVVGSNTVITDKTEYTDTATTIAPYFSRRAGTATMVGFGEGIDGQAPVFSNIQSSNKPMNVYANTANGSTLTTGAFNAISNKYKNDTAVGGGADGYAELGNVLSYNGKMIAGDAFRCGTMLSGGDAVIKKGVEHTFFYNFENLGKEAIHFTVQGVNSGASVEGPVKNIDLEPGASAVVSFSVTYKNGDPNKNFLAYFTVMHEITNMKLGVSANIVLGRQTVSVSLKAGIEGFTLADSYLNAVRHVGDTLTLPAADDYTDTNAKRRVIGWKDAEGNALTDGAKLTKNLVLVPVFEISASVRFELPDGVTFTDGFAAEQTLKVGDKLVLPTADQINNTLNNIGYWYIKDTTVRVDNETEITGDMIIVPYIEPDRKEPVTITAGSVDGFTLSADYLARTQYKGDALVLPAEGEFTYDAANKKFEGWMDQTSGKTLDANTIIDGNIVLVPKLTAYAPVTVELPDGLTLRADYSHKYLGGETLVLPTADDITATPADMGAPLGWFDAKTGLAVSNETVVPDEGLTIAPYWEHSAGYNYVKVGSGSNSGYNTSKIPGEIVAHLNAVENKSATYTGLTKPGGKASIVYGGANGYSVLGSWLTDSAPVTAGSAIRFDSAFITTGGKVVEFHYTVQNRGTTALRFSIYQIDKGADYNTANYDYESKYYRVDIDLASGESTTAIAQYYLSNTNALTYIVFEKDVSSFDFGIAIAAKILDGKTEVAAEYKDQDPLRNPVTLTYVPADNGEITIKENSTYLTQRAGRFLAAPKADDYTAPEGVIVAKWQLVIDGKAYDLSASVTDHTNVRVPSSGATLKAVLAEDLTVTWQNNNGVTATDAKTSYKTGEKLVFPTASATTSDGRTHIGWFDSATKKVVTADTVVTENMTLAPYFAPALGTALMPASGEQGTDKGIDSFKGEGVTRDNFTKDTEAVIGDEKGLILHYSGPLAADNQFRFKTSYSGKNGKTYKFTFKFVNYGSKEVSFTVYQVTSGTDTKNMPSKKITLAPENGTDSAELSVTLPKDNGNALTLFNIATAASGLDLGITMSVETVA